MAIPDAYVTAEYLRKAAEMVRVVKKEGWVVVADTDWATASVDFSDPKLERRLLTFFADTVRPNGYAGRQLPGLVKQSGLANIKVELFPLVQKRLYETPFGAWLRNITISNLNFFNKLNPILPLTRIHLDMGYTMYI